MTNLPLSGPDGIYQRLGQLCEELTHIQPSTISHPGGDDVARGALRMAYQALSQAHNLLSELDEASTAADVSEFNHDPLTPLNSPSDYHLPGIS